MVALVQRVRKLEKKVADRSQNGRLDDRVVYQPSAEDLAEAVAILVECGAVGVVDAIVDKDRKDSADGIAI
jgi:hypothetical protein